MTVSSDTPPGDGSIPSHEALAEVYEELRRLATIRLADESKAHTLQATALVHEAWLKLSTSGGQDWETPAHFYAVAAQAMRRVLIDNARRKSAARRGGLLQRTHITVMDSLADPAPEEDVLLIEEGLKELEKVNPRRAQIVVLKFYGGLTNEQAAQSLGRSERSVERDWACAKTWLFRWMSKSR
ncbi:MAG TPA: ECF-type sigma factor [Chthoniobacterales bacterium]